MIAVEHHRGEHWIDRTLKILIYSMFVLLGKKFILTYSETILFKQRFEFLDIIVVLCMEELLHLLQ